jgi:UPF0755 protein
MLRNLFRVLLGLIAIGVVIGAFVAIYVAMTPRRPAEDDGILAAGKPFPTATAFEDLPLAFYLQLKQADLTVPVGTDSTPILFTVAPGELPADVAGHLQDQGLIKDADLFVKWVKYLHVGGKIQAGDFVLRRNMTADEIIEALQHGRAKTVTFTIRPGWRAEEVAEYLSTAGLSNYGKDQFLQSIKNGKFDNTFLQDRPKAASTSLEGYLFPETYNVPFDTSVDGLLTLVLGTFDQRVTDSMRKQAAASKMTLYEVVTLASIVEREAAVPDERPLIASVYLNRLKKKQLLQADPTVQYALGYQTASKQWWKSPISLDEYQNVKSPYNTYMNAGLPPGPICSPSLDSIRAVLEPAQTDYLFFLGKGDGSHVFSKTYEEHQQNMIKYGYK